jgi:hypothetical protein
MALIKNKSSRTRKLKEELNEYPYAHTPQKLTSGANKSPRQIMNHGAGVGNVGGVITQVSSYSEQAMCNRSGRKYCVNNVSIIRGDST